MHFAMEDDPLPEAFAVLILDLQPAVRASPLLHGGVRHRGLIPSIWPVGNFGYLSFSGFPVTLKARDYFRLSLVNM